MDTSPGPEMFGRWLDLTMANRGIMGRTLARKVGVGDPTVSRWRKGAGVPGLATLQKIATVLGVDPIRLAVTAGLFSGEQLGIKPLPLPEPTAQRNAVKEQLSRIRGLTNAERQRLLQVYDEMGARA